MIEGVDSTELGATDAGADRDRPKPCPKRAWCVDVDGHVGACTETPRYAMQPPDFGPGRKR